MSNLKIKRFASGIVLFALLIHFFILCNPRKKLNNSILNRYLLRWDEMGPIFVFCSVFIVAVGILGHKHL